MVSEGRGVAQTASGEVTALSEASFEGMNELRLRMLRRQALGPMPSTSSAVMAKVRAMDTLAREDGRIPIDLYREQLAEAMDNRFDDYQGTRISSMAGRLMDYLDECAAGDGLEWPSKTPDEPVSVGYWPYGPNGDPDLAGFEPLDMTDTFGSRDRWRRAVCGDPPWKPGQVAESDAEDDGEPALPDAA
jgi:hypothetical protein